MRLIKIHTLRQRWFKIIGIVICSCLLLIAFTLPAILPVFTLPSPSGPYKIGTLTYRWNDSGRKDMLSTEDGNREVLAQIWYPSDKVSGSPESYIDNGYEFSKGAAHVVNTSGTMSFKMPDWIPLACYSAIAAGTLSGGWKIVKTMGSKITKVSSFEGVAAETAGALTLYFTEHLKIPVSTTHTITGSIIGVGLTKRVSAVRWGVTVSLLWAWVLTIPVSGLLAAFIYYVLSLFL